MPTITPTVTYAPEGHRNLARVLWPAMSTGDVGAPVNLPSFPDCSVQVEGTFGGATVAMVGADEATPANYRPLTDPQGNAISMTAKGIEQIEEIASWIRPTVTGGAGSGLAVTLVARRAQ